MTPPLCHRLWDIHNYIHEIEGICIFHIPKMKGKSMRDVELKHEMTL
jgi:hypothetical protein